VVDGHIRKWLSVYQEVADSPASLIDEAISDALRILG